MAASMRTSLWLVTTPCSSRVQMRAAVLSCAYSFRAAAHQSARQYSWNRGYKLRQPSHSSLCAGWTCGPFNLYSSIGQHRKRHRSAVIYVAAVCIGMIGATYAAVPLYRLFCQVTGLGGQSSLAMTAGDKVEHMKKVKDRVIQVRFNADTNASMMWNFRPQQSVLKLVPGETALAFYKAKNPTDKAITGISTYSVVPFEAGQYFNKIQCFCFEEQRLNPHEEVDMPVFFYIDPEFAEDPKLQAVDSITLSYTFFEVKDGMQLPSPPEYATRAGH